MHSKVRVLVGILVILTLLTVGSVYGAQSQSIIYVNHEAAGNKDGSSWTDAYTDLQDALEDTAPGEEIWVAQGIYYPAPDETDRAATFELKDGVALYGGFGGTETERDQRDWETNVTVLSGDLDRNDIADANGVVTDTANISGTNACNVVEAWSVTEMAVLDGFSITAGRANCSDGYHWYGAGMYNSSGSPTLTNVTFSGNWAMIDGGGMANRDGNPTLTNVAFTGNRADQGGGMRNKRGGATLTDVTFSRNRANLGGGMNTERSNSQLTNITFSHNQASSGGGMYNWPDNPTLVNVAFIGNTAESNGGGMYNFTSSSPILTNVIFSGNKASQNGGGMYNTAGSPMLTNVTFSGNHAAGGGGMYNVDSNPILVNSILWGNWAATSPEIHNDGSTATITYSDVEWSGGVYTGTGNINQNPVFVAPVAASEAPTTAGDYRLQTPSPAVDAGLNAAVPVTVTTDLAGNSRIVDGTGDGNAVVDMGAYELQQFKVYLPLVVRAFSGDAAASFELGGHIRDWSFPYEDRMHYAGMDWAKVQVSDPQDVSGLIAASHDEGFRVQLTAVGTAEMSPSPVSSRTSPTGSTTWRQPGPTPSKYGTSPT